MLWNNFILNLYISLNRTVCVCVCVCVCVRVCVCVCVWMCAACTMIDSGVTEQIQLYFMS